MFSCNNNKSPISAVNKQVVEAQYNLLPSPSVSVVRDKLKLHKGQRQRQDNVQFVFSLKFKVNPSDV